MSEEEKTEEPVESAMPEAPAGGILEDVDIVEEMSRDYID